MVRALQHEHARKFEELEAKHREDNRRAKEVAAGKGKYRDHAAKVHEKARAKECLRVEARMAEIDESLVVGSDEKKERKSSHVRRSERRDVHRRPDPIPSFFQKQPQVRWRSRALRTIGVWSTASPRCNPPPSSAAPLPRRTRAHAHSHRRHSFSATVRTFVVRHINFSALASSRRACYLGSRTITFARRSGEFICTVTFRRILFSHLTRPSSHMYDRFDAQPDTGQRQQLGVDTFRVAQERVLRR